MGNEESSRPRSNVSPRSNVFENDPDETKLLEEQIYLTDGRTSQDGDDDDIPVPPPYIPDASLSPESEAKIPIFDDDHSTPITGLPVPSDHNTPVQEALSQESAVANSNSTPVYSNLSTPPGQKNQTPFAVYIDDDDQITPDTTDKTPVYLSDTQNETHKTSEVNTESNVTRSNSIISSKTGYSKIQSHGLSPVEYQSLRNCLLNLPLEGQEMQEKAIERVASHILIQDYEARTDILMKGKMATSDVKVVCGVCEAQHITKPADHWCSECEEGLCDDCLKFHKASKSSRHHGVISVHDYKQLPSSVTSIVQYCQEHDRKYQNYCPQHESLCCPICIANDHKDCVRIQALEEILKTAKTSTLLDSMVQSLTGIKTNLNNIIADRKQNLGKIKEQREEINSDIELTREKLNKQLDVLQQNLLTDLTTNEQRVTSEIEMLVKRLEERLRHVDDLQHRILAVKQYASDLQAFLGSKSVETEVEKEEKYIQSLMTDGSLQQVELICNLDETLLSRLSNAKSFGTMTLVPGRFAPNPVRTPRRFAPIPVRPGSFRHDNKFK